MLYNIFLNKKIILLLTLILLSFSITGFCSENYIIGEGDVLSSHVYENDDLSKTVRVSADNSIRVPLLGEVIIKGLTVSKIASKLENLLADGYLVSPQVDVFIKEFKSKTA
ncbi:MAG: periplasmic polysaccharide biosynthesis/export protein, partial [Desulfobacteraceae bacterium]|nr:periplasmic polysaccharide biosynthesis/export protein [Desulfobacteraceae bacterium]